MPGRVFISCGQSTTEEIELASSVRDWFISAGYTPYVAIKAQSIDDVNSSIIGELRRSDYYVFIDFKRESLVGSTDNSDHRGSLFTNQELSIAYILGFQNVIFLQQSGVRLEGLIRYMASNAQQFEHVHEILPHVQRQVADRSWSVDYSRHFVVSGIRWSDGIIDYASGQIVGRFLYLGIENRRPDVGAFNTTARLSQIQQEGQDLVESSNRSPLKATGIVRGYSQTIWPDSEEEFDLLAVGNSCGNEVFLNTAMDVPPVPVIREAGHHRLHYEVFAEGFEVVRVEVLLVLAGNPMTATAEISAPVERL